MKAVIELHSSYRRLKHDTRSQYEIRICGNFNKTLPPFQISFSQHNAETFLTNINDKMIYLFI